MAAVIVLTDDAQTKMATHTHRAIRAATGQGQNRQRDEIRAQIHDEVFAGE